MAEGWELGSGGVPGTDGRGASGSPWGRPDVVTGGLGSDGFRRDAPCLPVGAKALGWESRPNAGARAWAVPKGCSIGGDAGQASRWVWGAGLGPPPKLETQEERSARAGVSRAMQAGVVHGRRVPGWTEVGLVGALVGPAGLGQSRTPCRGGSRGAGALPEAGWRGWGGVQPSVSPA